MRFRHPFPSLALTLFVAVGFSAVFASAPAAAQNFRPEYNPLYDDTRVATIRITIDPALLDSIHASGNEESDFEHPATFEYDDGTTVDVVENVGFRLRGNTSRYSAKKSYKVSFNTFESGRKYSGVEKLNLNGEHNDPSIIRSKLAWDLFAGHGVAASRSAPIRLFINGVYYGVYANTEHLDEQFLQSRFGGDSGTLYKNLYPADLVYLGPTGESYRPTDESRRPYDLKLRDSDDEGYDDLAHFVDVLNNTSEALFAEEIEKVFDVNGFLRSLAVDVLTGSWDNYWFLKNNYYLYNNPLTGLFEYIPYDFDNSFGIWWDGIEPGADWGSRDLYNWGSQNETRPLTDRILAQQAYVGRFSFFINELLTNGFDTSTLHARVDELHALITDAAEADTIRTLDYGFTIQDFHDSFSMALGDHVTYGLKPFITARHQNATAQLVTSVVRPIILDAYYSPVAPSSAEPVYFYATVRDDNDGVGASLEYSFGGTSGNLPMFDDGTHGDEIPGDGKFAGMLPPTEQTVTATYRFVAEETSGRKSYSNERTLKIGYTGLPLFINELMASNDTTTADEFGDYDDWVEIYNGGSEPISLAGLYLTDNLSNPDKFAAPDTIIAPGGFVLVWLDDESSNQGPLHLPFKLSAGGEQFGIFDANFDIVDAVTFGEQETDVSYGRTIDGAGRFELLAIATPQASNVVGTGISAAGETEPSGRWSLSAYPNPFRTEVTLDISSPRARTGTVEVYDVLGRRVYESTMPQGNDWTVRWDGSDVTGTPVSAGLYVVRVQGEADDRAVTKTLIRVR